VASVSQAGRSHLNAYRHPFLRWVNAAASTSLSAPVAALTAYPPAQAKQMQETREEEAAAGILLSAGTNDDLGLRGLASNLKLSTEPNQIKMRKCVTPEELGFSKFAVDNFQPLYKHLVRPQFE